MKEIKIKGYMTFRNGEPLPCSILLEEAYNFYKQKAPIWQKGDESVPVILTYNSRAKRFNS